MPPGGAFPSESEDLNADLGWIACVQDTAALFNENLEVSDEVRDAASARLDAVMGRYHQFMGVAGLEGSDANSGNCGALGDVGILDDSGAIGELA